MTTSCAVTFVRSSILSTVACGVGTHPTSFPAWPLTGSKGFWMSTTACADALTATREHTAAAKPRVT